VKIFLLAIIFFISSQASLSAEVYINTKTQDLNKIVRMQENDLNSYTKAFKMISWKCNKTKNNCSFLTLRSVANTFWLIDNIADGDAPAVKKILNNLEDKSLSTLSQILKSIEDSQVMADSDNLEKYDISNPGWGPMSRAKDWLDNYINDRLGKGKLTCDRTVVGKIIKKSVEGGMGGAMHFDFMTINGETIEFVTIGGSSLVEVNDVFDYNGNIMMCLVGNNKSYWAKKVTVAKK
jgi:hypothetical protein